MASLKQSTRLRADVLAVRQGLAPTRQKAQELIRRGIIFLPEKRIKPATFLPASTTLCKKADAEVLVSRAGEKLQAACRLWADWAAAVSGAVCLDVGAAAGGFTQELLRCGALQVYAVDVGHGQFDQILAQDPRVTLLEGVDIRTLGELPRQPRCFVVDVSFISLTKVLPAVRKLVASGAWGVVLVKPQFEVGPAHVNVRGQADVAVVPETLDNLRKTITKEGFQIRAEAPAPIVGRRAGNQEYLWLLQLR